MKNLLKFFLITTLFVPFSLWGQSTLNAPVSIREEHIEMSYMSTSEMVKDLYCFSYEGYKNHYQAALGGRLPSDHGLAEAFMASWLGDVILESARKGHLKKVASIYKKITGKVVPNLLQEHYSEIKNGCYDQDCLVVRIETLRAGFVQKEIRENPEILKKLVTEYRKLP